MGSREAYDHNTHTPHAQPTTQTKPQTTWQHTNPQEHGAKLDAAVRHERDYYFDYFGFKTLERSYLLKLGKKVRGCLCVSCASVGG